MEIIVAFRAVGDGMILLLSDSIFSEAEDEDGRPIIAVKNSVARMIACRWFFIAAIRRR